MNVRQMYTLVFRTTLLAVGLFFLQDVARPASALKATGFDRPNSFSQIAKETTSAVVNISTKPKKKTGREAKEEERTREFYERFFGHRGAPQGRARRSLGSGFVVESDGYILTNNHVVGKGAEIMVTFGDGNGASEKEYSATLVGSDPKTDLALIKIEPDKPIPVLKLGDSDKLQVGEWVMAIGNPFGFSQSVTVGVVSAKGRVIGAGQYDDFIQTDASINPGNSGGPLLNTKGEVVGINTAIFTGGNGQGNIGIGFAIPANMAKEIYEDLKKGKISRGWLGVSIQSITPEIQEAFGLSSRKGALVSQVFDGSPAMEGGIMQGDIIVKFDGEDVPSSEALPKIVGSKKPGNKVRVNILRDGKKKTITMKLGEMPTDPSVAQKSESASDMFGMKVEKITPDLARRLDTTPGKGVVVSQVERGGPAAEAGVAVGDMIMEINRHNVNDVETYESIMGKIKPGKTALMVVKRKERSFYMTITAPE